jgi:GNAT superfamily N-acetyltransferase
VSITVGNIREIVSKPDLDAAYEVLQQLRPHLSLPEFHRLYEAARRADEYTLVGVFRDEECLAVMGYRILHDFVRGTHLYIDDLVTTEGARSTGIGATLLKHAEEEAVRRKLKGLRLSTGVENERGKRFYEREGWTLRAVAYTKSVTA